ncbi:MAG: ShlB/FhaC/HecB family hemolysin secretion/activation protein [Methylococcales bacterium]|nr:ShlB/FhaC/HecB family hemolysin secretion/activation protein [Methylococcales bacterium]
MLKNLLFTVIINFFLITLCYAAPAPQEINFFVKEFYIQGESPLTIEKINDFLKPYQNQHYTLERLNQVASALEERIRTGGYSFYRIILPPQTLTDEKIQLKIISFVVNRINIKGNKEFSQTNILSSVPPLIQGQSPNTDTLSDALKLSNRHPFKKIKVTFKQSENDSDKIDATITVKEKRPYQAFLIFNNTGTNKTGQFRVTAALQHGNLWGLDHQMSVSYTTSPDHIDTVKQYGVNYSLPLYRLKGILSTYYAFSDVDNGIIANDFSVTGSGEMYGLHYQQFLPRWGLYEHSMGIGIDNRFFINDVKFLETPIGNSIRSVPISLLYKGEYPWKNAKIDFHLQWVGNTGWGGHNRDSHYQESRFNAQHDWHLFRYGANVSTNFKEWLFKVSLTGQYSDEPIISGEQLGIGGRYSVRGYNERETSADSGQVVNLEVYTPHLYGVNLLAFYDYGYGHQQNVVEGEVKNWVLSSVGVGIRWQWKGTVFATLDLAHALDKNVQIEGTQRSTNSAHASLVFRF